MLTLASLTTLVYKGPHNIPHSFMTSTNFYGSVDKYIVLGEVMFKRLYFLTVTAKKPIHGKATFTVISEHYFEDLRV